MYKKIMVPLDGSKLAECVFPHVQTVVNGCGTRELVLLRVVEPERVYNVSDAAIDPNAAVIIESERAKVAEEYLKGITNLFDESVLNIEVRTIVGRVAESLVDFCVKADVDLIIIATHGRSGVTRWVRGSVADKILRSSTIPVMMIRAPGTENGI